MQHNVTNKCQYKTKKLPDKHIGELSFILALDSII